MNENAKNKINETLENNDVCLFMKGTPESPQCGFSLAVSNVLKHLNVNFKGINVLEDPEVRDGIKAYSDWPTIPQLYVKKEFIGGCDIIKEMFESGDLQKKFEEKDIKFELTKK
jgi:monothiol glutaredoxin|tara:strand:- start:1524 stop:1865 length:342 start_codon:yes stop_codon:yes gene_type:complete